MRIGVIQSGAHAGRVESIEELRRRTNATECYYGNMTEVELNRLQWGRRTNATEWHITRSEATRLQRASMGPPHECDGV